MSESERLVEELVHNPPRVELTTAQKVFRALSVLCAGVAVVALVLALVAVTRVATVAACTNDNLGLRNITTAEDAQAHIDFAQAVQALFLPRDATAADKRRAARTFRRATDQYVRTLVADQQYRAQHPLGRC
ncbi:MAG TPA: hypothetical protein VFH56_04855 [Acidimicrobiales bacterium]|nr:hypothetical protein [Acidimicrobiales bacterium]